MCPEARHRGTESLFLSLVFLLKRRECSRVAAERIGGGYSLAFFVREELWSRTRNSRHLPPSSFRPLASRAAKHTQAHTDSSFLDRLKPFPRFYILDEIPAALCPFITFANQMMSLDILRMGFIVTFYAGRTASVKRIRAECSRLIGYHRNSFAVSFTFLRQTALQPFFPSSHSHVRTSYTVLLPLYCQIFRGSFPCKITRSLYVSFYDKPSCVTRISNAMKPI